MIHVFFHSNDLDGKCSGAIARMYLESKKEKFEMHPIDYPDHFPGEKIHEKDTVYFLDYTTDIKGIKILHKNTDLIIIDHHKVILDKIKKDAKLRRIKGLREITKSGCELSWEYFFPKKRMPLIVNLLGRYDVHDLNSIRKWENEILPFQFGIRLLRLDPSKENEYPLWLDFFKKGKDWVNATIKQGNLIIKYQNEQNRLNMEKFSFGAYLKKYKALCINTPLNNSQVFESKWDPNEYDIMLRYCYLGNQYVVSLYTDKERLNVGNIAKKFGGGGHPQAAGFECENITFKHRKIKVKRKRKEYKLYRKILDEIEDFFDRIRDYIHEKTDRS